MTKTAVKVLLQDAIIVFLWLLIAPVLGMLNGLPWWAWGAVFMVAVGVYFIILFYSNAELFKALKNDYAWSLSTGLVTLLLFVIPSVMWSVHNNIYEIIERAFT